MCVRGFSLPKKDPLVSDRRSFPRSPLPLCCRESAILMSAALGILTVRFGEASRSVKGSLAPVARFSAVGQARPASGNRGVPRMWLIRRWVASLCALFACASPLFAQDGRSLYKGTCAACHDSAVERIPSRETLNAMTPERVLAAMESGPMIAMASRLSASERRAVAEFAATSSPRRCRARAALCCSRCSR